MKRAAKKTIHIRTIIPIWDVRLRLIVSDDLITERKKLEYLFGPAPTNFNALCSYSGGHNFALFFEPESLTPRIIGHEIWHLTKRICEWSGVTIADNDEASALLCGWLHWWVYDHIGNMIRPDLKP